MMLADGTSSVKIESSNLSCITLHRFEHAESLRVDKLMRSPILRGLSSRAMTGSDC